MKDLKLKLETIFGKDLEIIIRMILDLQFINKFKISIMMILKALMEILFLFKEQRNKI